MRANVLVSVMIAECTSGGPRRTSVRANVLVSVIAECTGGGPRRTPVRAGLAAGPLQLGPVSGVRDPGAAAEAGGHRHDPLHPAGPERRHVTEEGVHAKIQQAIIPYEDLLTIVKRPKLQWYGHVSYLSGLAKTTLQGTVKGGRRQGRQKKRLEDNIREWTGISSPSPRAVKNREKWKKVGCEIICGAPTTLRVKG